jgi:hypothetical protein
VHAGRRARYGGHSAEPLLSPSPVASVRWRTGGSRDVSPVLGRHV